MSPIGGNQIVDHLLKLGRPVTEASYLAYAYPTGVPSPLPAEIKIEAQEAVEYAKSKADAAER